MPVDVRALGLLAAASCGFDTSGVGTPGGTTVPPMSSSTTSDESSSSTAQLPSDVESSTTDAPATTTGDVDDGLCNGVPITMLPIEWGPISEIEVHAVAFSGTTTNVLHVGPGEVAVLELDYTVASCDCPGCITQAVLGFIGDDWRTCFYNDTPGCNAQSGTAMIAIETPSTPGFYPLAFWRTWEFSCNPNAGGPDLANAIAGLCVDAD